MSKNINKSKILDLEEITLIRNKKIILDNISWKINSGENWALIGENGSGKTTLLKVISGFLWPTQAKRIKVLEEKFGEVDLRELRKQIGWVSMDLQYELNKPFKVFDVVISGIFASIGVYEKVDKYIRKKAVKIMKFMQCFDFRNREFNSLSQGEQKRVIIARALISEPKLLILDEPCTGLDLVAREQFLKFIEKLAQKQNLAIIYVTHHVEEIMPFISHCLVLKQGKVYKKGVKHNVINSENLSKAFDLQVKVIQENHRFWTSVNSALIEL